VPGTLGLDELLQTSDVLSLHVVLTKETRNMIGARELALMKPGAILVNTSRGPIVVEKDLIQALQSQRLHAALDVYEREPLPADHPLRKLDNVTLSPHLGYVHEENYRIFYRDTVENVAAFMAGKPIRVINE
jgi:phosphoglycerate dehydrogenase-like enzyme